MGMTSIRLNTMLPFDENQEADLIELVEELKDSHKIGGFIANLIRIASENPELLEVKDGKYDTGELIKSMQQLGKYPARDNYVKETNLKLLEMQKKVDSIYEMCLKMYTMSETGKLLGFEKKTENMILAEFMVEQQLGQLQKALGADCSIVPFAANRLADYKTRAAGTLEYIISCYEPIINELKRELKVKELEIPVKEVEIPVKPVEVAAKQVEIPVVQQQVSTVGNLDDNRVVKQTVEVKKEALTFENISKMTDEDDTEVDLGSSLNNNKTEFNEDVPKEYDAETLGLLSDFFNDGM